MKHGMTYVEYIEYLNHLFLQQLVDFDYYENANSGSTYGALEIVGE